MANPTSQALESGNELVAGPVFTEQVNLAADTYYQGMPLKYVGVVTASAVTGDGGGSASAASADANVLPGAYTLTATAALVMELSNPDGEVIEGGLALTDGDSKTFHVQGLHFTVTDAGTAFSVGDTITLTVTAAGVYSYDAGGPFDAFYNGPTKTLSSAGYGFVVTGGEIYEGGIVDDSGSALSITVGMRTNMRRNGFAPRRVA